MIDDDIVLGNWTEVGIVQIKLESHNVMVLNVISFAP